MQLTGRTPTDHIVVFDGNPRLAGELVQVAIHEATPFTLFGEVLTGEHIGGCGEACEVPVPGNRFSLPLL
jgi:tRNA-2-methylthio-N6-dimethylallyladenosine synthase